VTRSLRPRVESDETVGYVIAGRAELTIEGQTIRLESGDSWLIPAGFSDHVAGCLLLVIAVTS